ncbi:MAG: cellulase family glycosylhydrolase [Lachnospiraceae bacterium]|nr:cellulase family glycosylhydrolase [Lachnospiraceae bacterium]
MGIGAGIMFVGVLIVLILVKINSNVKNNIPEAADDLGNSVAVKVTDEAAGETAAADESSEESEASTVSDTPGTEDTEETAAGGMAVGGDSKKPADKEAAKDDKKEDEKKEGTKEEPKDGYILTYGTNNSWENGGLTMCGVDFQLTNKSKTAINGWELKLEISGLSQVDGWNGSFKVYGDTLSITNAEYNGTVEAGGSVTCGCNMGVTGDKIVVVSASVNGEKCTVIAGAVNPNAQNNAQNNNEQSLSAADVDKLLTRCDDAVQGDDWLHTDGHRILDKNGKEVWLTGVNWFGYNTGTNTFDGLWNSELVPTVKAIADHGFNLIRVPMSAQLLNEWAAGTYPRANYNNAYNSELNSMNSLQIFEYFLSLAEANGIKVMIDIHSAETDASGHNVNLWCTDKVKTADYLKALGWMAERYKNNDTIIAYDLKNEPHGKPEEGDKAAIWNDSKDANNWKYVAEQAAAAVLDKNPNVLIMVEGCEIYPTDIKNNGDYHSANSADYHFNWWGGNLRGVKDYPVDLGKHQDKLVYSPHDYGPTVYEQPWFKVDYDYDSLMQDCWHDNWFYIYEDDTAPLLIGEWGGFMREPNLTWMTHMRTLIGKYHLNHTFWCLNANSGDTGGLLLDDFKTWDQDKYDFVKEVLWQEKGKFVGLDHKIALGDNGISLSEAAGLK